jgi:hypothetical protein
MFVNADVKQVDGDFCKREVTPHQKLVLITATGEKLCNIEVTELENGQCFVKLLAPGRLHNRAAIEIMMVIDKETGFYHALDARIDRIDPNGVLKGNK